ncbi:Glycerophosphoryl diester phosphodiesterase family-domain-containing protein [Pseudoneurospora amorphoporcata]|uniref:Glycerophosphoryl diester phosphodiesterase family-domain-containing protein n=1 Tax=Pseudoneurospora amorphoporcata TaxID=241081 RepID=A0AAN6NL15_9PEZI|nr:Glycerophosphoryl diester phosphodiesterase family-domain-containing protein [Pseudoneurospora amorphoporcata]
MKFGRNLPRNQVPEWAAFYINYKGLKKLIRAAQEAAKNGEPVDLAEFFFALDRNLEDVDSFYNKKYAEAYRRLKVLQDRYGRTPEIVANLDDDEVEELMGALLELRGQFRKLQWFGEINRRGFVKITKKLDKKVPNTTSTQHNYISTKVDLLPFTNDTAISRLLTEINKWLSKLGEAQNIDDAKSERSTLSLGRASAKAMLNVPSALLERLDQAIRKDDVAALEKGLKEGNLANADGSSPSQQPLLLNLLQRSVSSRSRDCIIFLLKQVKSLDEPDDINERNCIHRLVIHIGRTKTASLISSEPEAESYPFPRTGVHYAQPYLTPATSPLSAPRGTTLKESKLLGDDDEAIQLLKYLLENLRPDQRVALTAKDAFGRIPLHYAAQFGFVVVCQIIMRKMQDWGQFNVENGIDAPEWQDKDGNAPLHLSVIGGHPLTTKALLQGENWKGVNDHQAEMRRAISKSSAVLALATKANSKDIVELLVNAGVDINWQDNSGETALHVVARFGHDECARVLLKGTKEQKANLELAEKNFAWTPLHIAAVDGHLGVAQLLVDAGADVEKLDSSGWTAKEHAALRGHLEIARLLSAHSQAPEDVSGSSSEDEKSSTTTPHPETENALAASLGDRRSNGNSRPAEPVKTFGHRYLKNESLVLVSLGSMDMRKGIEAITLDKVPLAEAHTTQLDTALSVVVSAQGALGDPTMIDLPVHENISTEPILFTTRDASKVRLFFDIVPTYSGNEKNKVGRGVALLSSVRPTVGTKRMNLQGDISVPIMGSNFEVIGTVNFNFLVITPFSHPKMEVTSQQTYWKKLDSTMVIGHRGLGKNVVANKSLQLGENTIPSFIAAANLGAQYVEFDVQLTKDHVPVIYHDFLVSETGFDAPVHTLTLEQFLHINPDSSRSGHAHHHGHHVPQQQAQHKQLKKFRSNSPGPRQRSMSMDFPGDSKDLMEERMKHTRDFKEKGYKGNSRGNFIQAPFATLEDLFRKLPETVGFNIEMKYPMLHESEEHEMDTYAVELNSFCDTVLQKVYDMAGQRHIIFSSFNPDICLCLSFKQPNIPILFLTDAGTCPVGDIRASSLQEAIRFASRWNLLGIVSNAEPLINSPRLVRVVKQSGLVCVSYGVQNNDPSLVQKQVKEGIDAVIVDSVLAIRKGLTRDRGNVNGTSTSISSNGKELQERVREVEEAIHKEENRIEEEGSSAEGSANGDSNGTTNGAGEATKEIEETLRALRT